MILLPTLGFGAFAITVGLVLWLVWRERDRARIEAIRNARLAELGQRVDDLAHQCRDQLGLVQYALESACDLGPDEREATLLTLAQAVVKTDDFLATLRVDAGTETPGPRSALEIVRSAVTLYRTAGWQVSLEERGDLMYEGARVHVISIVHNLLSNATKAIAHKGGGVVTVVVDHGELRISNRFNGPIPLDARIYRRGYSGTESSGTGLAAVRERTAQVGWDVTHIVERDLVCFIVREACETEPERRMLLPG